MLIHLEKLGKSFGEKVVLHDVSASVEKEDRIGIVGQNGAGKTTLLKILTGVYTDYDGEFSVTHGVTLGYLEQNAKLDTLDIYGEMRSSFAPVLDAMAQMQILEKKMAAAPMTRCWKARRCKHHRRRRRLQHGRQHQKVLSGMGFAQDTWSKNVGSSGGELTRLRLAKLLLESRTSYSGRAHQPLGLCHHGMAGKLPQGLLRCGPGGQPRPLFPRQRLYQDLGSLLPDHDHL
ncbi:MAG: ATP-binding cassette domain-containing protein [Faecalibacterium prausnitzii]